MTIATYGGYTHTPNEVNLANIDRNVIYSPRNERLSEVRRFRLEGEIIADTQAEIITKIGAIEAAYRDDGKDFRYTLDNGTLCHALLNSADCTSGVRVVKPPCFPKGDPEELVTTRTFSVVLEGTYEVPNGTDIVSFQESITVEGDGGPLITIAHEMPGVQTAGGPLAYVLCPRTIQYYHQNGEAVGYNDYPEPPGPINPEGVMGHMTRITKIGPRQVGNGFRFYTRRWSYTMFRDIALFGAVDFNPTVR